MKKIISIVSTLPVLLMTNSALAAGETNVVTPRGYKPGDPTSITELVSTGLNFALGLAGLISVIYIIIGGFNYITSSGNVEKVQAAQKTITYAVIGLIIVALAFAIKSFILTRLIGGDVQAQI